MKVYNILSKTLFLAFLSFAFIFVSCKDDDKEPDNVDNNEIVGKWQLEAINSEVTGNPIAELPLIQGAAPCIFDLKLTFTNNNKVTPSDCDAAVMAISSYIPIASGTDWKVENGTLKLTNGATVQTLPLKQETNKMTITVNTAASGPANNALLVFKRI